MKILLFNYLGQQLKKIRSVGQKKKKKNYIRLKQHRKHSELRYVIMRKQQSLV